MNISIGKLLATHGGRDKFVRTLCYASRFCATIVPSKQLADSLNSIGKEMSGCRTTLRLFDDIPMLNHVLSYGLGKEDEDLVVRILTVVGNAVDVVYYPFEHAAWAADHRLLSLDSRPLWTATSFCWAISMYLDLLKYLRHMAIIRRHKSRVSRADCDTRAALTTLMAQQRREQLAMCRCVLDLIHAVHTLPEGVLWSGKLSPRLVALVGTLSSLLGLYMILPSRDKVA
ncbi:peroxisomal membrane protein 11C-like isoform X2 [Bacillus rossius redtenbacheri]|uniref:peroxisomal membrane protein 11C-like isoform X2 n=1 Tax=Bacillus rossius redtenbacheri TaxID=93214 RepID=UPI002FDE56AA